LSAKIVEFVSFTGAARLGRSKVRSDSSVRCVPVSNRQTRGKPPLVVNGVVVGPFEVEEQGTGIASDVVKMQGEDPATPGPLT